MTGLITNLLFFFRWIFIIITLPVYFFILLHYKFIVAFVNKLRSVFTGHKLERHDIFFLRVGGFFAVLYMLLYLGVFEWVYHNGDFGRFQVAVDNFYNTYIGLRNIGLIALAAVLGFFVVDKLLLIPFIQKNKNKPMGKISRYFARQGAIKKGRAFVGSIINQNKIFPFKKKLYLTDNNRSLNVQISGTTGSGKSESVIFPLLWQDICQGKGAIIIDSKGDMNFFNKIHTYHKKYNTKHNQKIWLVNLSNDRFSNTYNPIFRGRAIEIKDRIMGSIDWSEIYYKTRANSTLLLLLQAIESIGKKIAFRDLYNLYTKKEALEELTKMVNDKFLKGELESKMVADFKNVRKECAGLIDNLYIMSYGGFDNIVNTYSPEVDLLKAYQNNDIIYFILPTNLLDETARSFGRMLLMDLKSTAGYISGNPDIEKRFYPVFVDEPEFLTEPFVTWLNKTRSTGMCIHIAHQSLGDLERVNQHFVKQVIDNTNLKIIFRANDSDTAENYSKMLGTFKTVKKTERVNKSLLAASEGEFDSEREVDEFYVSPNVIKNDMKTGQALVIGKEPNFFWHIINTDYLEDPEEYLQVELEKNDQVQDGNGLDIESIVLGDKREIDFGLKTDEEGRKEQEVTGDAENIDSEIVDFYSISD